VARVARRRPATTAVTDRPQLWIDIAVRGYPVNNEQVRRARRDPGPASGIVVVVDTETRVDFSQRLLFGSYRVYAPDDRLIEEGLIVADDLADWERQLLEEYRHDT
jgi:hypothetical protein